LNKLLDVIHNFINKSKAQANYKPETHSIHMHSIKYSELAKEVGHLQVCKECGASKIYVFEKAKELRVNGFKIIGNDGCALDNIYMLEDKNVEQFKKGLL